MYKVNATALAKLITTRVKIFFMHLFLIGWWLGQPQVRLIVFPTKQCCMHYAIIVGKYQVLKFLQLQND